MNPTLLHPTHLPIFLACLLPVSLTASPDESPTLQKAAEIVVPSVEFEESPLRDAIDFLVQRSRELDDAESDPAKRGVNVAIVGDLDEVAVTLDLAKIPLDDTLRVVADLADATLVAKPGILLITPDGECDNVTVAKGGKPLDEELRQIVVPSVEFAETPPRDAVDFLQSRSVELDPSDTGRRGVNIALKLEEPAKIDCTLHHVSLRTALQVTALAAGLEMEIRENLVFLRPLES